MKNEQHENELKKSHAEGFGGTDAKMVAKVGMYGVDALTRTEVQRVLEALGRREATPFEGNVYTEAGHLFEDWVAENHCKVHQREVLMERRMADSFRTFAHADFVHDGNVVECKFTQGSVYDDAATYRWQLQWYYLLGAESVTLLHGTGQVLPFEVESIDPLEIAEDERDQETIYRGVTLLDEAVKAGYFDTVTSAELVASELTEEQQAVVGEFIGTLEAIKDLEKKTDTMRERLQAWMEESGIASIKGEGWSVTYVGETVRRTFDAKKAQAAHPDLKGDDYYKESKVKASVKISLPK